MIITVQRKTLTPQSTRSEVFLDGLFCCYGLEPPTLPPPAKPRAIPAGTYPWYKAQSAHFGCETVWLQDVPDFEDVEIHFGNAPDDTRGCLLVGSMESANFVGHSREAFAELMQRLPATGTIQYLDPA